MAITYIDFVIIQFKLNQGILIKLHCIKYYQKHIKSDVRRTSSRTKLEDSILSVISTHGYLEFGKLFHTADFLYLWKRKTIQIGIRRFISKRYKNCATLNFLQFLKHLESII